MKYLTGFIIEMQTGIINRVNHFLGEFLQVPTIGFNCERIRGSKGKSKGVNFIVWDVGGQVIAS